MPVDNLEKPQSCYELLEVSPEASDEDIKRAYRRLALKYHPDRWQARERRLTELRFRAINEAYAHLKTPERRAVYDSVLLAGNDNRNLSFWAQIAEIFRPAGKR